MPAQENCSEHESIFVWTGNILRPAPRSANADDDLIFENEPIPAMIKDKQVSVYAFNGFWLGMDTPREYYLLNELWDTGHAPWKIW